MTAKEKAIELVNKYKPFVYCYSGSGMLINQEDEGVILNFAKQCALIAVDEILEAINIESVDDEPYSAMKIINIDEYWQEVKNEINNL